MIHFGNWTWKQSQSLLISGCSYEIHKGLQERERRDREFAQEDSKVEGGWNEVKIYMQFRRFVASWHETIGLLYLA